MLDDLSALSWWLSPQATIDEPEIAVVGDTWQWTKNFNNFPASSYTLAYFFASAANAFTIAGANITTNGNQFLISFPATSVVADKYRWQAYATSFTGVRSTVVEGWIRVTPNLAANAPVDLRSPARQLLAAIDTLLAGKMLSDTVKYTIGNRSLEKMDFSQLKKLRDLYAWKVEAEDRKERILNGLNPGKRLLVRFDNG